MHACMSVCVPVYVLKQLKCFVSLYIWATTLIWCQQQIYSSVFIYLFICMFDHIILCASHAIEIQPAFLYIYAYVACTPVYRYKNRIYICNFVNRSRSNRNSDDDDDNNNNNEKRWNYSITFLLFLLLPPPLLQCVCVCARTNSNYTDLFPRSTGIIFVFVC